MATRLAHEGQLQLPELLQPYAHERPAGAQTPADQAARRARVTAMRGATEALGATEDRYLKLELKKTRTEQETQEMEDLQPQMEGYRQVGEAARAFLYDQVAQVPGFWSEHAQEQHEGSSHRGLSGTLGWPGEECRLCFVCHATHVRMTANGVPEHQQCQPPSVITGKTAQKHIGTKNAGSHSAHESAYELRSETQAGERRTAKEQQERAQEVRERRVKKREAYVRHNLLYGSAGLKRRGIDLPVPSWVANDTDDSPASPCSPSPVDHSPDFSPSNDDGDLPPGWERLWSKTRSREYFYSAARKESVWTAEDCIPKPRASALVLESPFYCDREHDAQFQ